MRIGACLVLLGLGLAATARPARAERPKLAVARVETTAGASELGELLTRLLREEVERVGRYRSIGTPRLSLKEMMSAVDCANDSPQCLSAVGRELGVVKLVIGKLDLSNDRYLVTLQLFDVPNGRVDLRLQKAVVGKGAIVEEFPPLVRRFLGLRVDEVGTLEVTANQPGVRIFVDGVEQGFAPLRMDRLGVGDYRVVARKSGFPKFETKVRVDQDKTAQVTVVLGGSMAPPPVAVARASGVGRVRWSTWVLLGAGVAAIGAGAGIGVAEEGKQSDFNTQVKATGGTVTSASQGMKLLTTRDDGKSLAAASTAMFVVGGTALVAGAVLLWRDLRSERTEPAPAVASAGRFSPFAFVGAGLGLAGVRMDY